MKYNLVKYANILMGSLMIPIGTYGGFLLGSGLIIHAIGVICFQMTFAVIQALLWWKAMEIMKYEK